MFPATMQTDHMDAMALKTNGSSTLMVPVVLNVHQQLLALA
jgi:hypothetical protein